MTAWSRAQTHRVGSRIMSTLYACIMTRWHQNAFRVPASLYGEFTDDRWFPNIGPIMLNFYVSCVVNQTKLFRNSRISGDMRRRDSCDATVLEVPTQINGPYTILYQKHTLLAITMKLRCTKTMPLNWNGIKVQWPNSTQALVIQIAIVHNDTPYAAKPPDCWLLCTYVKSSV